MANYTEKHVLPSMGLLNEGLDNGELKEFDIVEVTPLCTNILSLVISPESKLLPSYPRVRIVKSGALKEDDIVEVSPLWT